MALLPGWVESLAEIEPFKPTVDLLRHQLLGVQMPGSAFSALAKLILFGLVLAPLAGAALTFSLRVTQRRGTIAEY